MHFWEAIFSYGLKYTWCSGVYNSSMYVYEVINSKQIIEPMFILIAENVIQWNCVAY